MENWQTALITFFGIQYLATLSWNIYCHRFYAHRHCELHPIVQRVFRFIIWFVIGSFAGANWQQIYSTIHRKHHRYSDTEKDPFSPYHYNFYTLATDNRNRKPGDPYYIDGSDIVRFAPDVMVYYSLSEKFYNKFKQMGKVLLALILFYYFGFFGLFLGAVNLALSDYYLCLQLVYLVHKWGEPAANGRDHSRNNWPLGFFMAGEELHANHHMNPARPNFASRCYEIDASYVLIKLLSYAGLAKINYNRLNKSA